MTVVIELTFVLCPETSHKRAYMTAELARLIARKPVKRDAFDLFL